MAQERLTHRKKKESTAKWFIFSIIPIVNLYWLWKVAEIVSGHEKHVPEKYQTLKHMSKKEPTGKWFAIFLVPILLVLTVFAALDAIPEPPFLVMMVGSRVVITVVPLVPLMMVLDSVVGDGVLTAAGVLLIATFLVGVYVLYKTADINWDLKQSSSNVGRRLKEERRA